MARLLKKNSRRTTKSTRLRGIAVALVAALGVLFLITFMFAHWVQRQLLTTDNWVEMVAPLPKDEEVASSVADYTVNRLFEGIDVEQRVAAVLPEQASFVAPALAERIDSRATAFAKEIIQSDQFQGIWIAANRQAHSSLVERARADSSTSEPSRTTELSLNLQELSAKVRDRLGVNSQQLLASSSDASGGPQELSVDVDTGANFASFDRAVDILDFLNGVMLLAAVALLLGALALSGAPRRLLLILLGVLALISLLQLIGLRVLRPEIINQVEQSTYQPAAGVVYDELVASFRRSATGIFVVSAALFIGIMLAGSRWVRGNKYVIKWRKELRTTPLHKRSKELRVDIFRRRWLVFGVATVLVLVFMAFVPDFDWQGVVRAFFAVLVILAVIHLLALNPANKKTV